MNGSPTRPGAASHLTGEARAPDEATTGRALLAKARSQRGRTGFRWERTT